MSKIKSNKNMQKITPCLWIDKDAEKAAQYYIDIFGKRGEAKIISSETFPDTPSGTVEVVTMRLFGQNFTLMAAGPQFKFNEAISFVIDCANQEEVDYYWHALTAHGGQESMCGWLKDKYGLSWQVVPKQLTELMSKDKSGRVMQAMLQMKKIIVADVEKAYEGK
jgi:predicted 3-demethylubiquinone-9 3-methyltransferase (glyoxalase superfamily)